MQHILFVTVRSETEDDEQKLQPALLKLISGNPAYRIETNEFSGETSVYGVAEAQLRGLADLLRSDFDIKADVSAPQVAYKETITQPAEAEGRYVMRAGGFGLFGHAVIRLSPADRGSGYRFESRVTEDILPDRFVRAVDEGIRDRLGYGVLGYPVVDVQVELCGGSFDEKDSSEMTHKIAGASAFRAAEKKAHPIVIEPVMTVHVLAPPEHAGNVLLDLTLRRGRIISSASKRAHERIRASVPLAEILAYAAWLRAQTNGHGSYSIEFDRYAPAPIPPADLAGDDPCSHVPAPLRPGPPSRYSRIQLPEPNEE